jgi:hypothetical protein
MRPRLIGIEQITIAPIDAGATRVDELTGEPLQSFARSPSVTLPAQFDEFRRNQRRNGQGGATVPYQASVTFRARDVEASGWQPRDGDRITQIADKRGRNPRAVDLYLSGARRIGKDSTGRTLIVLSVSDKAPSRGQNEGI